MTATIGRFTSPTRCAAANTSTTGAWPNCTPRKRPTASVNSKRWGAVFDRTKDGKILQRNFGGHRYPRLAHVGDRTGLEMIRTLQDHGIHQGIDGPHGTHHRDAAEGRRPRRRRVRLRPRARTFQGFQGQGRRLWHRRHGPRLQNHQQFLGIHRRRPIARLSCRRGADRHGVHSVSSDRHDLAAQRHGHSGHRRRARRRRRVAQQRRQALHVRRHSRTTTNRRPRPIPKKAGAIRRATKTRGVRRNC